MSNHQQAILLFLQLGCILVFIRLVGLIAKRFGQPQVVAEMIAGVMLGPSLLGALSPETRSFLFPSETISTLYLIAQIGLVLYMYTVGLEFDLTIIKSRVKSAIFVSTSGILAPFALGSLLALLLAGDVRFFNHEVTLYEASLFLGSAMSITAFPMLARIILEKGLANTSTGTLALAAGSFDDAVAWCLLALVLASFNADPLLALTTCIGGLCYALVVLLVLKPRFEQIGARISKRKDLLNLSLAIFLPFLMFGAWLTDLLGIYAIFGAFIAGIATPRGVISRELRRSIEPLTTHLLLPLFFVYSGLNTDLTLLLSSELLWITLLTVALACIGKGLACWASARLSGETNYTALRVGALMNARGLMELILLNIGLERGLISPMLFSVMVIMAITTTLMTSPLLSLFDRIFIPAKSDESVITETESSLSRPALGS